MGKSQKNTPTKVLDDEATNIAARLSSITDPVERAALLARLQAVVKRETQQTRQAIFEVITAELFLMLNEKLSEAGAPVDLATAYNELDLYIRDTRGFTPMTKRAKRKAKRGERQDLPISHLNPDTGAVWREGKMGRPAGFVTIARDQDQSYEGEPGPVERRLMDAADWWRTHHPDRLPRLTASRRGEIDPALLELRQHLEEQDAEDG